MGSRTTARVSKKRDSPNPNDSGDDIEPVKRLRHDDEGDKENRSTAVPVALAINSEMAGRSADVPGKSAEAGIIQKIYVENFMCHRKFTVDLNRNINFIYGQNGSGKSAILAAIQICLGAGARRTHRAGNLKDLVRKDAACNCAKVRVTLLNREDGYQYDIYGSSITVERTIALRGGYNGYKLFDSENKEQSRSKKDLDDMLDKLNIQVDNPVAILDQEEAKKFLLGKPSDKYLFFMKATELERIDRKYASTLDKVVDLDTQSFRMKQGLEADLQIVEETKKAWEQHQEIDKLEAKLRSYHEGYAWSCYQVCNNTLETKLKEVQGFKEKVAKKREQLSQVEQASQGNDEEETAKRNKVSELTSEANVQAEMKRDLEQEVKRASAPLKALERQLKYCKRDQHTAAENLRRASQRLQEKRDEILARAGSAESEQARRTKRLDDAEKKLMAAKEKHAELKQAVTDSLRVYEELEPDVEQARNNVKDVGRKVFSIEAKIRELQESSHSGNLAMFGPRCPKVKQMVDRALQQRRFRGPVLGPIGAYVKIVGGKEHFASIAEYALQNGTLDRFIVTNDQDRQLLQKIRKDAGCNLDCGIFQVSKHAKYDVPGPPVEGVETVASVLNITDDLVFNCLVDNCKIEERALSRSREESERLLLIERNGRKAIRGNIKTVFCLPQGDNWSCKGGQLNLISADKRLKKTIGVDKSAALADANREAEAVKEEMEELRKEESRLEHLHLRHRKTWNIKKREHQSNTKEMDKLINLIGKIKDEEQSAADFDNDTSEEEQEVSEAQQAMDRTKEQERSYEEEIKDKKPELENLKSKLEEVKIRNEKVLQDIMKAEGDLASYVQGLTQRQEKLEKKREKVKEIEQYIEGQEEEVGDIRAQQRKYLLKAKTLSYRRMIREKVEGEEEFDVSQLSQDPTEEELEKIAVVETKKDPNWYEARIKRAKQKIEQEKERRNATKDDPAIAYQKYVRAKNQLDSKTEKIKQIEKTSAELKEDLKQRKQRWKQFRSHIGNTTNQKFDEILNMKGSSGQIEYDFENMELNLVVQKDSMDATSQQKDVKALSGGERSFATIALLLGMGESLETPFRVLDEFDVFLDPVARKLTIDKLIMIAKNFPHRQFIFITPQDVSNVKTDPMLQVFKMTPPVRISAAGLPTQQTLEFSQS